MPENKKTNAVNFKNMTPAQRKEQMAKWKQERTKTKLKKKWANQKTTGNNKTNKTHRNNKKEEKRKNLQFVKDTAWNGTGFGNKKKGYNDPVSKAFSTVAGTALTGGVANTAKAKGLVTTAKAIKTGGKVNKINSL